METNELVVIHLIDFKVHYCYHLEWLHRKFRTSKFASIQVLDYPKLPIDETTYEEDDDQPLVLPSLKISEKYNSMFITFSFVEDVIIMNRNDRNDFKKLHAPGISSLIIDDESDSIFATVIIHMTYHNCQRLNLQKVMNLKDGESIWKALEWGGSKRLFVPVHMCLQYENNEQLLYVMDASVGLIVFNAKTGEYIKNILKNSIERLTTSSIFTLSRNEMLIVLKNTLRVFTREDPSRDWKLSIESAVISDKNLWICDKIDYDKENQLIYIGNIASDDLIVLRRKDLAVMKRIKLNKASTLALDKQSSILYTC